jgi:pimeloyl-ACP methyl ester carboxylesterase
MSSRPEMTWERVERDLAPPDFTGVTVEEFKERARGWALGSMWRPEIEQAVLANFEVLADNTIRARLSRDRHMKILRSLWELKSFALYDRVECPALLIPAMQEPVDERMAQRMQGKKEGVEKATGALRHSRVLWMEDTIHDIPLQRPEALAKAIADFVVEDVDGA